MREWRNQHCGQEELKPDGELWNLYNMDFSVSYLQVINLGLFLGGINFQPFSPLHLGRAGFDG